MNKCFLLVLLWLGVVLGGCSPKIVPANTGRMTPAKAAEMVKATNVDFRYLKAKGKIKVDMPGVQQTANLSLRMRKDSVIWLSVSLGIEGVRAYITRDSIQVLNYLQREYYAGNFDYLSKRLNVPVTFEQVQAALLGNYITAPAGSTPTVLTENASQKVQFNQASVLITQLIELARGRMTQLSVVDSATQNRFSADYSDFRALENSMVQFAYGTVVKAQPTKGAASTLTINYRNVDVDKERLAFPFSVPKGYVRKK
ncbi:protein of unknown function [Hymenobacter daecheongensis DSM 21074]|uniref:DUF4292 domain-containing protein n=1 Tax=Hymenobacter daecheongensis DSM 21074 TaxID=1121955 RepID=A0A1M6LFQ5_9BACT|nr:DUF4292 domain-containing protein [Hymenobacter daecheongensis]SHJ69895.1 protein of unknown function [Hymenobacter daecheongensis DSM 21074]